MDLRLTALERKVPLTDDETVKLGKLLTQMLRIEEVSFPDDTTGVVAHGYEYYLPPGLVPRVAEVLGDFEEALE